MSDRDIAIGFGLVFLILGAAIYFIPLSPPLQEIPPFVDFVNKYQNVLYATSVLSIIGALACFGIAYKSKQP